ncbi:uncharacterized protein [Lepeophtheirus salmonis]|uniref:uncharacterized protein isoform X2 n=1 Tax=Lepeophtheirus salmonis TaxID=72036 RepID=UPI003AF343BF
MLKGLDTARLSLIIQDILRKLKESPEGLKDYKISLDSYPRRPYSTREISFTSISSTSTPDDIKALVLSQQDPNEEYDPERLDELIKDINEKAKKNPDEIKNMKISWASLFKSEPSTTRRTSKTITTVTSDASNVEELLEGMDPKYKKVTEVTYTSSSDMPEEKRSFMDKIKSFVTSDSSDEKETEKLVENIKILTDDEPVIDSSEKKSQKQIKKNKSPPVSEEKPEETIPSTLSAPKELISEPMKDTTEGASTTPVEEEKDTMILPEPESSKVSKKKKKSKVPLPTEKDNDQPSISTKEVSPEDIKTSDLESPRTLSDSSEVLINSIPSNYSEEDIRRYLLTFTLFKGFDTARLSLIIQDILRKLKESPEGLKDYKISLDSYPRRPYSTREISFTSISSTSTPDDIKALVLSQQDPNEEYDPERLDELIKDINEKAKKNPDEIKNMKISWDSLFKSEPSTTRRTSKTITTVTSDASNVEELLEGMDPKYKKVTEVTYTSSSDMPEEKRSFMDKIKSFVTSEVSQENEPEKIVEDHSIPKDEERVIDSSEKKSQKKKRKSKHLFMKDKVDVLSQPKIGISSLENKDSFNSQNDPGALFSTESDAHVFRHDKKKSFFDKMKSFIRKDDVGSSSKKSKSKPPVDSNFYDFLMKDRYPPSLYERISVRIPKSADMSVIKDIIRSSSPSAVFDDNDLEDISERIHANSRSFTDDVIDLDMNVKLRPSGIKSMISFDLSLLSPSSRYDDVKKIITDQVPDENINSIKLDELIRYILHQFQNTGPQFSSFQLPLHDLRSEDNKIIDSLDMSKQATYADVLSKSASSDVEKTHIVNNYKMYYQYCKDKLNDKKSNVILDDLLVLEIIQQNIEEGIRELEFFQSSEDVVVLRNESIYLLNNLLIPEIARSKLLLVDESIQSLKDYHSGQELEKLKESFSQLSSSHTSSKDLWEVAKQSQRLSIDIDQHIKSIWKQKESNSQNTGDDALALKSKNDIYLHKCLDFIQLWESYEEMMNIVQPWLVSAEEILSKGSKLTPSLISQFSTYNAFIPKAGSKLSEAYSLISLSDEDLQRQLWATFEKRWFEVESKINSVSNLEIDTQSKISKPLKFPISIDDSKEIYNKIQLEFSNKLRAEAILKDSEELLLEKEDPSYWLLLLKNSEMNIDCLFSLMNKEWLLSSAMERIEQRMRTYSQEIQELKKIKKKDVRLLKFEDLSNLLSEESRKLKMLNDVIDSVNASGKLNIDKLRKNIISNESQVKSLNNDLKNCKKNGDSTIDDSMEKICNLNSDFEGAKIKLNFIQSPDKLGPDSVPRSPGSIRRHLSEIKKLQDFVNLKLKEVQELESSSSDSFISQNNGIPSLQQEWSSVLNDLKSEMTKWESLYMEIKSYGEKYKCTEGKIRSMENELEALEEGGRKKKSSPFSDADHLKRCEIISSEIIETNNHVENLKDLASIVCKKIGMEDGSIGRQHFNKDIESLIHRLEFLKTALSIVQTEAAQQVTDASKLNGTISSAKSRIQKVQEETKQIKSQSMPSSSTEPQIASLREHLLELGRIEAETNNNLKVSTGIDGEREDIKGVLKLWQSVFQETFARYQELSCALSENHDIDSALDLWKKYLGRVEKELDQDLPKNYDSLLERKRIYGVHKTLLEDHHQSLSKIESEKSLPLSLLHENVIKSLDNRAEFISERLKSWEEYKAENDELFLWLKQMEREKARLHLKHVPIHSIDDILQKIEYLLEKTTYGESLVERQQKRLSGDLATEYETNISKGLKTELHSVRQRISSLKAGLRTWKDHLLRVKKLSNDFDLKSTEMNQFLKKNTSGISLAPPNLIPEAIQKYKTLRLDLEKGETIMEEMKDIETAIKEYASPEDIKCVSQKLWLNQQKYEDLHHDITIKIQKLEEQLALIELYNKKFEKFMVWASQFEDRIKSIKETYIIDLVPRFQHEIDEELMLKQKEVEWLKGVSSKLLPKVPEDSRARLESHSLELANKWSSIQAQWSQRLSKWKDLNEAISKLEKETDDMLVWINAQDRVMVSGIPFVDSSKESIRKALSGNETFLKSIKKKSPELSQILNDSEVVLSGCHDLNVNVDLVRESVELLSMRWARLCSDAEQRKPFICDTEAEWKHFKENCQGLEEVLSTLDNETSQKGWESYRNRLGEINTKFCDMARKGRLDKKGDIKKLYQDINNGWVEKSRLENKPQWAREVNFLRGVDAQVTELQFSSKIPEDEKNKKLKKILTTLRRRYEDEKEDEKYSEILLELWKRIHELLDINILPLYASQKSRSSVGATQYQELETPLLVASSSNVNLAEFSPSEIENELASISAVKEKLNSSTPKEKLKSELESSLSSFQAKLDLLYKYLKSPTPIKSEEISIVHDITERLLRVSRGYLDNSNYISEILMNNYGTDEEYARKGKINEMEGKLKELEEISHSKHKRVLNARRNVKQLDQDLWRLQKYIEMAHSTLGSLKTPPDSVEDLEDVFQDHREFLMEMDSHKSLMMSVNVVGKHLISHYKSQEKASELQNRLNVINAQWDEACEAAILWQIRLQTSFLQNAEFHRVVDDLSKWLDETTISIQSCEPINLNLPSDILQTKLEMFDDLLHDLKRCEPRIVSLRETADMLQIQLDKNEEQQSICIRVKEKLRTLSQKFRILINVCHVYSKKLSRAIGHETGDSCEDLVVVPTLTDELLHLKDSSSTQRGLLSSTSSSFNVPPPSSSSIISSQEGDAIPSENGVLRRSYTFLGRVVRAAVPIQAIMLLLLGVSSIVPLNQEDLICTLQNNLERSFEPVIRWSNGPPPI